MVGLWHAPLEITGRAVNEHGDEEDAVEIWDGRCCADDQAPGEAHGPVGHVVLYFGDGSSESTTPVAGFVARALRTGLRETPHQPLVRRRLLQEFRSVRMVFSRRC